MFLLADAFAGLHVSAAEGHAPFATAFRTEPPSGVPAADGLTYASASPVTRLTLRDSRLTGVEASLFAHYRWKMGDTNASSTPAVTFTLQLKNARSSPINASLLLSMPLAANEGYSREGPSANETATGCGAPIDPGACAVPAPAPQPTQHHAASSSGECQRLCTGGCTSWTFSNGSCTTQAGRPPQPWRKSTADCTVDVSGAGCGLMEGVTSGLAGAWTLDPDKGLTHSRPGEWDASGGITLRAAGNGTTQTSYTTSESPAATWKMFVSGDGRLTPAASSGSHAHGAAAATVQLEPGETRTMSVVLAWYLPHALYTGEALGVWYSNLYSSSEEVAEKAVASLEEQVRDAVAWNRVLTNTSLPDWLSALLVNTPATEMESGFRLADGRYRQYDNIVSAATVAPMVIQRGC